MERSLKMACGIYMYENKGTGQKYIGQSVNIQKRKWEHLHNPSSTSHIDKAIAKYGEEAFNFSIIEECSADQLDYREQYWIDFYDSIKNGYNIREGGTSMRGEKNASAVLSEKQVMEIIQLLEEGKLTNGEISKSYNVSLNTIDLINRCQIWSYLHKHTKNIRNESYVSDVPFNSGENNKTSRYKEATIKAIIYDIEHTKTSLAQLARNYNVSESLVYDLNRCRTWTYLHNYKKNIRREFSDLST